MTSHRPERQTIILINGRSTDTMDFLKVNLPEERLPCGHNPRSNSKRVSCEQRENYKVLTDEQKGQMIGHNLVGQPYIFS